MLLSFTKNNKKRLLYFIFFLLLIFNEEIIKRKRILAINQRTNTNLSSTTTKVAASYGCGPCLSDNKQHIYLLLVVLCHNYKCYPKAVFKRSPFIIRVQRWVLMVKQINMKYPIKVLFYFTFFWHTIRSGVWGLR